MLTSRLCNVYRPFVPLRSQVKTCLQASPPVLYALFPVISSPSFIAMRLGAALQISSLHHALGHPANCECQSYFFNVNAAGSSIFYCWLQNWSGTERLSYGTSRCQENRVCKQRSLPAGRSARHPGTNGRGLPTLTALIISAQMWHGHSSQMFPHYCRRSASTDTNTQSSTSVLQRALNRLHNKVITQSCLGLLSSMPHCMTGNGSISPVLMSVKHFSPRTVFRRTTRCHHEFHQGRQFAHDSHTIA